MNSASSFALLLVLPVAALLLLGACDEYQKISGDGDHDSDVSCTLIGCHSQTRLELPADRPPRVQVRFDGNVVFDGCLEVQPNGSYLTGNRLYVSELYSSAQVEVFDLENCDQERSLAQETIEFSTETFRPNGPKCEPECQLNTGSFSESL